MATSRDDYIKAVQDARVAYEGAVDEAFAAHRDAIRSVRRFLEPADGDGGGRVVALKKEDLKAIEDLESIEDLELIHLQLAGELAANGSSDEATDENREDLDVSDDGELLSESALSSLNGSDT
jgi:hypothetical protein